LIITAIVKPLLAYALLQKWSKLRPSFPALVCTSSVTVLAIAIYSLTTLPASYEEFSSAGINWQLKLMLHHHVIHRHPSSLK